MCMLGMMAVSYLCTMPVHLGTQKLSTFCYRKALMQTLEITGIILHCMRLQSKENWMFVWVCYFLVYNRTVRVS